MQQTDTGGRKAFIGPGMYKKHKIVQPNGDYYGEINSSDTEL